jgi:monovalent cation/hydrogen antiporter
VLVTAIVVRFVWVTLFISFERLRPPKQATEASQFRSTFKGGAVIAWAGMRGIVTLATAYALPAQLGNGQPFPYRDLALLAAFGVVLGTLVVQGLTLAPLIRLLGLNSDEDPIAGEVRRGRAEAYQAALTAIDGDASLEAKLLRKEYQSAVDSSSGDEGETALESLPGNSIRRTAIDAARVKANELRLSGAIGDEAFRILESEFDWSELSAGSATAE